jgi:uncharacterized protein (DUF1697 family)
VTRVTAWAILFRGVGGATQLPVKALREALEGAGFGAVATYVSSGNAVLTSPLPREGVVEGVRAAVAPLGFRKDVHALDLREWRALVAGNPFGARGKAVHAAVLGTDPDPARVAALQALAEGEDRIAVRGSVAYLLTPEGFGRSKLAERFDRGIGVPNTARNWNTVTALLALLEAREG